MIEATAPSDPHEARYDELWRHFHAGVQLAPALRRTRGRHRHAQIVAIVNDPALFRRLDRIRQAVAGFTYVRPVPDHFLHVPFVDLGAIAPRAARHGERSHAELRQLTERAREIAAELPPFSVDIARVGATPTEVFAELHPASAILAVRERLLEVAAPAERQREFIPRLPLAHATASAPGEPLAHALEWFRDRPIGRIRIASLQLIAVDVRLLHHGRHRIAELPLGGHVHG